MLDLYEFYRLSIILYRPLKFLCDTHCTVRGVRTFCTSVHTCIGAYCMCTARPVHTNTYQFTFLESRQVLTLAAVEFPLTAS